MALGALPPGSAASDPLDGWSVATADLAAEDHKFAIQEIHKDTRKQVHRDQQHVLHHAMPTAYKMFSLALLRSFGRRWRWHANADLADTLLEQVQEGVWELPDEDLTLEHAEHAWMLPSNGKAFKAWIASLVGSASADARCPLGATLPWPHVSFLKWDKNAFAPPKDDMVPHARGLADRAERLVRTLAVAKATEAQTSRLVCFEPDFEHGVKEALLAETTHHELYAEDADIVTSLLFEHIRSLSVPDAQLLARLVSTYTALVVSGLEQLDALVKAVNEHRATRDHYPAWGDAPPVRRPSPLMQFLEVGTDLFHGIVVRLAPKDVAQLSGVCKAFHQAPLVHDLALFGLGPHIRHVVGSFPHAVYQNQKMVRTRNVTTLYVDFGHQVVRDTSLRAYAQQPRDEWAADPHAIAPPTSSSYYAKQLKKQEGPAEEADPDYYFKRLDPLDYFEKTPSYSLELVFADSRAPVPPSRDDHDGIVPTTELERSKLRFSAATQVVLRNRQKHLFPAIGRFHVGRKSSDYNNRAFRLKITLHAVVKAERATRLHRRDRAVQMVRFSDAFLAGRFATGFTPVKKRGKKA